MRVIKDFPCLHVPMPWSRLALGEAGRKMARVNGFLEKAEKLGLRRCKATEAHSLSREVLLGDSPRGSSRLEPRGEATGG